MTRAVLFGGLIGLALGLWFELDQTLELTVDMMLHPEDGIWL